MNEMNVYNFAFELDAKIVWWITFITLEFLSLRYGVIIDKSMQDLDPYFQQLIWFCKRDKSLW